MDANTYQKTNEKCDNCVIKKIGKFANKYQLLLTKAEKLYLKNTFFPTSNFYGLPKLRKSKQISEAIQQQNNEYIEIHEPNNLTVRRRVGRPNCPRRPLSQLINYNYGLQAISF